MAFPTLSCLLPVCRHVLLTKQGRLSKHAGKAACVKPLGILDHNAGDPRRQRVHEDYRSLGKSLAKPSLQYAGTAARLTAGFLRLPLKYAHTRKGRDCFSCE